MTGENNKSNRGSNKSDGVIKSRAVLGDITNRTGKRGTSQTSDESNSKAQEKKGKYDDTEFMKKCMILEDKIREAAQLIGISGFDKLGVSSKDKEASDLPPKASASSSILENVASHVPLVSSEPPNQIGKSNLSNGNPNPAGGGVDRSDGKVGSGDVSRESCVTVVSRGCTKETGGFVDIDEEGSRDEPVAIVAPVANESTVQDSIVTAACLNNDKDLGGGNPAWSKSGSIEWSKLPNAECSKNFELGRCKTLEDDGNANLDAEKELLKGCSCSFCLKAAYMWSDLHYQDVKGRISVLRKSQKDANAMVQKTGKGKDPAVSHSVGSSNKPSKLESDLTNQWRSLFLHMEDVLLSESTKLHSSYHALRDLRENCKMDLESINGVPADRQ